MKTGRTKISCAVMRKDYDAAARWHAILAPKY